MTARPAGAHPVTTSTEAALAAWLERHTAQAPPALRQRVRERALAEAAASDAAIAELLAAAGIRLLEAVVQHEGDRTVALDLLAADALVTLALLARAEAAPAELGAFAAGLVERHGRGPHAGTAA